MPESARPALEGPALEGWCIRAVSSSARGVIQGVCLIDVLPGRVRQDADAEALTSASFLLAQQFRESRIPRFSIASCRFTGLFEVLMRCPRSGKGRDRLWRRQITAVIDQELHIGSNPPARGGVLSWI